MSRRRNFEFAFDRFHLLDVVHALAAAASSNTFKISKTKHVSADAINESKILGGTEGSISKTPYVVQIEALDSGTWAYTCTGLVSDETHIITAGHCAGDPTTNKPLSAATLRVRVGTNTSESGGTVVGVRGVHVNPKWKTLNPTPEIEYGVSDVSVLTLKTPLKLGANVKKAVLASVGQQLAEKTIVTVSSWGVTQTEIPTPAPQVMTATFEVISLATCNSLYKKYGAGVTAGQFCAKADAEKALCSGDSGAPVARLSDGKVFGIFSWGACGVDSDPSVFTDLTNKEIRSFLNSALKK